MNLIFLGEKELKNEFLEQKKYDIIFQFFWLTPPESECHEVNFHDIQKNSWIAYMNPDIL